METINLKQLDEALRDLAISLNEARSLAYSGKVIQCDRRLQGSQTKCNTILSYILDLRKIEEDEKGVMACENSESETSAPVEAETSAE